MIIKVKAKPSSKKEEILKVNENNLEIQLKEKAEKNKANRELIKILSKYFDVPSAKVKILKGLNSKEKIIEIADKK